MYRPVTPPTPPDRSPSPPPPIRDRPSRRLAGLLLAGLTLLAGHDLPAVAAPPAAETVVAVHLDIVRTEVEVDGRWEIAWQGAALLTLDELMANMNAVLGPEPFPPGLYTGVRLILGDDNHVTVDDGGVLRQLPLFVPSGPQTGLKMDESFEVVEGKLLQLAVAFDPAALRPQPSRDRFVLRSTCLSVTGVSELDAVATIGPEGGSLTTLDGRVELDVPAGALTRPETLSILRLDDADTPPPMPPGFPAPDLMAPVGPAYELSAEPGLTFATPVTLAIAYTEEEISRVDELHVSVHVYDPPSATWQRLLTTLDRDAGRTLAELEHFSTYRNMENRHGFVAGADDRRAVDNDLQQNGGFQPTQHIGTTFSCSGFLISNNLFMTNHHCLSRGWCSTPGAYGVGFNRILDPGNAPQAGEPSFFRCDRVVLDLPGHDVTVVELEPDPFTGKSAGEVWGYYTLDPTRHDTRAYMAGFPGELSPRTMWIDHSPGCGLGIPNPLWSLLVDPNRTLIHGCDSTPGSSGSPLVDFSSRNRVVGINHSSFLLILSVPGIGYWPFTANLGTFMSSVVLEDDLNGNQVLDIVEIDLTGGLTEVGFRQCVPETGGPCILRWFLPYRIDFQASGGVPPYTWSASGALPGGTVMSSSGVLEGPAPFCLCTFDFQVTVTDSLGVATTRTVRLVSGL